MTVVKLCAAIGLILAAGGTAKANISLNWVREPHMWFASQYGINFVSGHLKFDVIDWSVSKFYLLDGEANPTVGEANVDALIQSPLPGGVGNEDGWRLLRVQEIRVDVLTDPTSPVLWSGVVDQDYEIVGLISGATDVVVEQAIDGTQIVGSDGARVRFFIQAKGTADILQGSSGRGVVGQPSMYNTIGFNADGTPIAWSELIIDGVMPSDKDVAGISVGQRTDFTPDASGYAGGGLRSQFVDIVGGTWQWWGDDPSPDSYQLERQDPYFDPNAIGLPGGPVPHDPRYGFSLTGDLHLMSLLTPFLFLPTDPDADWFTTGSEEPGGAPEEHGPIGTIAGDVDLDGDIDAFDIQQILAGGAYENGLGWGWEHGDFDGDGDVDLLDISMIPEAGEDGALSTIPPGTLEAIFPGLAPEPATLALLAAGGLLLIRRRRK